MPISKEIKQIYFNDCQRKVMLRGCKTTVVVGGRRLGKSHGIAQPYLQRNMQRMPRGTHGIIAGTFQQANTRTLPGTLEAFDNIGFKRNVHYVIGRRPEPGLKFEKPRLEPASYDHCITWYNGSIMPIISQDVPGSSNSMTFDSILCDEAKFLDFEKLNNETIPANGGTKAHFGHLSYHHSMMIISDMPTTKKGSWFLGYEDKCDTELIENIDGIIYEKWRILEKIKEFRAKGIEPKGYLFDYYKTLCRDLEQLRSVAVDYNVFSSIENMQVLGEGYIKQMKRDLPPLIFQTSILCKRVGLLKDGFYNNLNENLHYYTDFDNSYILNLEYDFNKTKDLSCLQDGDLDINKPICISMDYNANINWIVAGQRSGIKLKVLKSFFVKYDRKLVELVNDFCHYYRDQQCKEVIYYYDNTALGSNYAVNDSDFATVVMDTFRRNKWHVTGVHIGNPLNHMDKHLLINMGLKGQKGLFPLFNKPNNEPLLLAMEQTGIYQGPEGFKKDKRGEKLAESDEDLREHRTDGTDAFDSLYIGMNNFPVESSFNSSLVSDFI
ncbi:MAG TPA: hypothetical protein VI413_00580 [Paludibacter sp.]